MASSPFELIPSHKASESIVNECVDLLSHVWRRNKQLRLKSLQNSSENLPTTLILVQKLGHKKHVLATAKLARVANDEFAVAIESVAVHPQIRGRGFGRYIMHLAEDYCRQKGFKKAYLWTHDQQCFYQRLGYTFTLKNVVLFTGSARMADKLRFGGGNSEDLRKLTTEKSEVTTDSSAPFSPPPPPRPPPPPASAFPSAPPPPPPPLTSAFASAPPPASAPPAPSPSLSQPSSSSNNSFQQASNAKRSPQPSPLSEPPHALHDLPTEERPGLVQRCQLKQCMMKVL